MLNDKSPWPKKKEELEAIAMIIRHAPEEIKIFLVSTHPGPCKVLRLMKTMSYTSLGGASLLRVL